MARFLMIAYTTYMHDGRVKRHAEALAERGDHVDVICLATDEQPITNGVNVIGLPMSRYRGESKSAYLRSYMRFFSMAAQRAARMSMKQRYDVVIVCTMPDAVIVCAILPKFLGSKVVLDVHDTMPELYRDKFRRSPRRRRREIVDATKSAPAHGGRIAFSPYTICIATGSSRRECPPARLPS